MEMRGGYQRGTEVGQHLIPHPILEFSGGRQSETRNHLYQLIGSESITALGA